MIVYNKLHKSPNFSSRHGIKPDTIIIHHTAGDLRSALLWFAKKESQVSAHAVIAKDGTIYGIVDPQYKAWHVGKSQHDYNGDGQIMDDEYSLNARSLGIELESDGNVYTEFQMAASALLCLQWMHLYNIPAKYILGHKEVSLIGKVDPGNFDMSLFRLSMDSLYHTRSRVMAI